MAKIGAHVSRYHAGEGATITKHIEAAAAGARKAGLVIQAAAIFVTGPRDHTVHVSDEEAQELREYVAKTKIVVIAHAAYPNQPWRGSPVAAASIRQELAICAKSGIEGLVVHLPVGPPEWVLKYLPRLYTEPGTRNRTSDLRSEVRIYLEHVACLPKNSEYETPKKIADLFQRIRKFDPSLRRVGFCIDTAHLWACGVDISSFELAEAWLNDLESISDVLPPEKIAIHLNDNVHALGSGKDEHAALLEGAIWSKFKGKPGDSGLAAFLDYATRHGTVVILERKPAEKLLTDYATLLALEPGLGEGLHGAED